MCFAECHSEFNDVASPGPAAARLTVTTSMPLCASLVLWVFACMSVCPDVHQDSGLRYDGTAHLLLPVTPLSQGRTWEETRISRFHARSSRSVFNLLTVKLISHPITQQLPPNWLLSFFYGWVCTWIYCRCAKVHAHCDFVISISIGVCTWACAHKCGFEYICTKWQK